MTSDLWWGLLITRLFYTERLATVTICDSPRGPVSKVCAPTTSMLLLSITKLTCLHWILDNPLRDSMTPAATCLAWKTNYFILPGSRCCVSKGEVAFVKLRGDRGLSPGHPTKCFMFACWPALGLTGAICPRIRFSLNNHPGAFVVSNDYASHGSGTLLNVLLIWMALDGMISFRGAFAQHTNFLDKWGTPK